MADLNVKLHEKQCSDCNQIKDLLSFRKHTNGVHYIGKCKDCENKANREYYKNNKVILLEKARIKNTNPETFDERKDKWLMKRYGISLITYKEMEVSQDNKCAICGNEDFEMVVDHCHVNKNVRGLLCQPCNKGLGMFRDNKTNLEKAIEYLKDGKSRS